MERSALLALNGSVLLWFHADAIEAQQTGGQIRVCVTGARGLTKNVAAEQMKSKWRCIRAPLDEVATIGDTSPSDCDTGIRVQHLCYAQHR